jgi:hypothetical protein
MADPFVSPETHHAKLRGARVLGMLAALVVLLIAVPAVISLASGNGAICFVDSACPLSEVNPCTRNPSFALVGRCAVALR